MYLVKMSFENLSALLTKVNRPRLFNMDLHISVIADFKNLFPQFDITDVCMSGHAWVFKKPTMAMEHINPSTWAHLDEAMIAAFQAKYDDFLSTFDGFICGHPNGFIPIFEKYNKPIIMINSCRYDLPFCWSRNMRMLESYKACLGRLAARGLLIAVSNNKADQLYTKLGCGLITTHIPSLCAYTGIQYKPTRPTFLCYHGDLPAHPLITNKNQLGGRFIWSDLGTFKGIIHIPYEISTMSMFEHFSAGIPLFFPSKRYMLEHVAINSVSAYWQSDLPMELSLFSNMASWLDLADYYEVFKSPNVYLFDSFEHLVRLLETFEWKDDRSVLDAYRNGIRTSWSSVLSKHFSITP